VYQGSYRFHIGKEHSIIPALNRNRELMTGWKRQIIKEEKKKKQQRDKNKGKSRKASGRSPRIHRQLRVINTSTIHMRAIPEWVDGVSVPASSGLQ
jgi:hypothetical protein